MTAEAVERVDPAIFTLLQGVSTATLHTVLHRLGYNRVFMAGLRPFSRGRRLVGQALTVRYLPAREDFPPPTREEMPSYPQRVAIELVQPGDIMVIDAGGDCTAGTLGDILITRIAYRGGRGVVVDGALRDTPAITGLEIPCFARCAHAGASYTRLRAWDVNIPVRCAGVLVLPGDLLVGDEDGVIVIPRALARQAAELAAEQERLEAYIRERVEAGTPLSEAYPPSDTFLAEYRARQNRGPGR